MPNVVASGQTNAEIWWFFDFQDGGRHNLGFINFHNFNCRNAQEVHTAISGQISWRSVKLSRRYADYSIFQYGGFPPSWICDARVWHTHEEHGLYHCAKFGWNRCSSFDNMHVFDFTILAWKCLFRPPKLRFWGTATKPVHRLQIRPIVHN